MDTHKRAEHVPECLCGGDTKISVSCEADALQHPFP